MRVECRFRVASASVLLVHADNYALGMRCRRQMPCAQRIVHVAAACCCVFESVLSGLDALRCRPCRWEQIVNVLIAEDEVNLADAIAKILEKNKYQVDVVHNGNDALDYITGGEYDVFVCDVMLPGMNGYDIVREARRQNVNTPIIMLTARTSLGDKVTGLDAGADDYMTKPFQPAELLARLRALTRRQGEVVVETRTFGDLSLDLSTYDLTCKDKEVRLSYKEFEVLSMLMKEKGRTIPKETLLLRIWGLESDAGDNNVEAYISFLRKKLKFLGSSVQIATQRKVGYRLEVEENS